MKRIHTIHTIHIACACVTLQSHRWKLCSNERFDWNMPGDGIDRDRPDKETLWWIIYTFHTIIANTKHIEKLSRKPDNVYVRRRKKDRLLIVFIRAIDSKTQVVPKNGALNGYLIGSQWDAVGGFSLKSADALGCHALLFHQKLIAIQLFSSVIVCCLTTLINTVCSI